MQKFRYPSFPTQHRPWTCQSSLGQFFDNIMYLSALLGFVNYGIIHVRTQKNNTVFKCNNVPILLLHKIYLINPSTTIYGNLGQSLGSSLFLRVGYFLDCAHVSLHRSPNLEAFYLFICILCVQVILYICHSYAWSHHRQEKGIRVLGTRVTDGWDCLDGGGITRPPEEQLVFFILKPTLQFLISFFFVHKIKVS